MQREDLCLRKCAPEERSPTTCKLENLSKVSSNPSRQCTMQVFYIKTWNLTTSCALRASTPTRCCWCWLTSDWVRKYQKSTWFLIMCRAALLGSWRLSCFIDRNIHSLLIYLVLELLSSSCWQALTCFTPSPRQKSSNLISNVTCPFSILTFSKNNLVHLKPLIF